MVENFGLFLARALTFFLNSAVADPEFAGGDLTRADFSLAVADAFFLEVAVLTLAADFFFVDSGPDFSLIDDFRFATTFLVVLVGAVFFFVANDVFFFGVEFLLSACFLVTDVDFFVPADLVRVAVFLAIVFFVLDFTRNHRLQSSAL